MNEENKNVETNTNPRDVQPVVLGSLRKEKIGKPLLVLEMFLLFAIVLIGLPYLYNQLTDEDSVIYKIIYGSNTTTDTNKQSTNTDSYLDASQLQAVSSKTTMKYENLIIKNIKASGKVLTVTMSSYNGIINLDEKDWYLEVYSSSDLKVGTVKLTGKLDYQDTTVSFSNEDMSFNNELEYYIKVVEMTDDDYPEVEISTDESGLGSVTCTLNGRIIEYTFKNGYLIAISDYDKQKLDSFSNENEYLNSLTKYQSKVNELGSAFASVEEDNEGFVYQAEIDLDNVRIPSTVGDYSYYDLDTEASKIVYAQKGKGFDCE